MSKAVYAGSFDPFTLGHLDILKRALGLYDEVVVLLAINPDKKCRFSLERRMQMINETINEYGLDGASVASTTGLTVDFAKQIGAKILIRGIRNDSDKEYEEKMRTYNQKLCPEIDTVFFETNKQYEIISSSLVRQYLDEEKDISSLVPHSVYKMIKNP